MNPSDSDAHAARLGTLARANDAALKRLAETVLAQIDGVEVMRNRTGLAMLPTVDPVEGAVFHLGEVLVSEAHIRLTVSSDAPSGPVGYGACTGRDLERAMAIAVLDAAHSAGIAIAMIDSFIAGEAARLADADADEMREIEATRVDLETF